ncbi:MAG: sigma-54-dependent transcriptional regulator, partial [Acidobacteriota bacterium]
GEQGLDLLRKENFDLILLDIWLPGISGLETLEKIKEFEETIQIIMITGHGSVESAVKATKLGAYDFLEKPLSQEKVVLTIKNALRQKKLEEENIFLRERMRAKHPLVGKSETIQELRKKIAAAAPNKASVLIYGENGAGKELTARLIHRNSTRKNRRFVQINPAAIPEELIEIELFGHTDDYIASTGVNKKGKIYLADRGTLFLDEISELSLRMQAKLIQVLEEGKLESPENSAPDSIDIRVIATTTRNLREMVNQKKFREDLFFKLNVIPLVIPPLRERKEDIPLLINYFLKYFSIEFGKKEKTMSKEAMEAFLNYSWPGNVSELINVVERFVIMVQEDEIQASHLSLLVEPREIQFINGMEHDIPLPKAIKAFEKSFIQRTLLHNKWKISRAAAALQVEKKVLEKKIEDLGIRISG